MNSAGYTLLARIPPTLAAATITTSGLVLSKPFSLVLPFEIHLIAAGRDHVTAAGGETAHDRGTDHAAVTCNVNPLIREIEDLGVHQIDFPPYRTLSRRGCGGPLILDRDHVGLTISLTSASKLVLCRHPSLALALLGSPSKASTSVGRK